MPPVDSGADALADAGPTDLGAPLDAPAPDAADCDRDGDGESGVACGGSDCDDEDPTRYPGATELCDADDEDCNDATHGADADGDGFESSACCNGPGNCGVDCDDALNTVNPGAAEQCNGGRDDDCDGLADSADGVCVPCAPGYAGFDGDCTDRDECVVMGFCGVGASGCTNITGTFSCTCASGYQAAAPTGALCDDVDECAVAGHCGAGSSACANLTGSFTCTCTSGFAAPATGGRCVDIDECLPTPDPCGAGTCLNGSGSYACVCPSGYRLLTIPAPACADVDECADATDNCSPLATCENLDGNFNCRCPAGYDGGGRGAGGCVDRDECALGADDCDDAPDACRNTDGSFTCACPTGYTGAGRTAAGCAWNDPSLAGLVVSGGTLSPAFAGGTTSYVLTLTASAVSTTLTPTVAVPARTTITVAGAAVASGAPALVSTGLAPTPVMVVVRTESGATRTYTVVVVRGATYVKASNTGASDDFGARIAVSADGSTLAVSAAYEDSSTAGVDGAPNEAAPDSGAVYVYRRTGTIWAQEAFIKASNPSAGDRFGHQVRLSANGSTLAVGAFVESSSSAGINGVQLDESLYGAGAVYVFTRSVSTWSQQAYVKASNPGVADYFGYAVALSGDGNTMIVGAMQEGSNATGIGGAQSNDSAPASGAVYVFRRVGTSWSQQVYVKASNADAGDEFGASVAISGDGSVFAAQATHEDSPATGVNGNQFNNLAPSAGAVYLFRWSGSAWSQEAYVKASNTAPMEYFGASLALSADGSTLVAGAASEDSAATGVGGVETDNSAMDAGAVYVFRRTVGVWAQEAYVKASNTDPADGFGVSVALSDDGSVLAVGALQEDSSATGIGGIQSDNSTLTAGAVYLFRRVGTAWSQSAYVKASNAGAGDYFGASVGLFGDGSGLCVSAFREASAATGINGNQADNSAVNAGAAYVY